MRCHVRGWSSGTPPLKRMQQHRSPATGRGPSWPREQTYHHRQSKSIAIRRTRGNFPLSAFGPAVTQTSSGAVFEQAIAIVGRRLTQSLRAIAKAETQTKLVRFFAINEPLLAKGIEMLAAKAFAQAKREHAESLELRRQLLSAIANAMASRLSISADAPTTPLPAVSAIETVDQVVDLLGDLIGDRRVAEQYVHSQREIAMRSERLKIARTTAYNAAPALSDSEIANARHGQI